MPKSFSFRHILLLLPFELRYERICPENISFVSNTCKTGLLLQITDLNEKWSAAQLPLLILKVSLR